MLQVIFVAYFKDKDYSFSLEKKISFDLFMHKHYRAMSAYMVQYKNVCMFYIQPFQNHGSVKIYWLIGEHLLNVYTTPIKTA